MQIVYINKDGDRITFGQQPPFLISSKKGFAAVQNTITSQKQYGLDGEYFIHQQLESRDLEIDGEITGMNDANLMNNRLNLIKVFNPNLAGVLQFSDNGRTFEIDVLVEEAPTMDSSRNNLTEKFSLKLKALDPYWMDKSEQNRFISLSSVVSNFKFPLSIGSNFTFGEISSGNISEIKNNGDVVVGMDIELRITANCKNPKVLNVMTQEFFGFNGTYTSGTTFNICTIRGKKEVTKIVNGVITNAMAERMVGSSFLQLEKGSNFLKIQADSGAENVIGSVTFSPLVVGV
ncbi:phage tail domain-containing protein [Bacillus cereus]|uniref:phage tail domain-containing protein n=1 Tax=Bacillus cereus TaxID=1396 RepID=UPI0015D516B4|nr:phage tail domain-containing protein [Bacillus cereus]